LQPLDVGVFQALKYNFKKEVRRQVFLGASEISRADFFTFFQKFHDKTFKNLRIHKSAFKKTGLIPLDPLRVLEKMKVYRALQRPQTPEQSSPPPILSSSPPLVATPPPQLNWAEFETPLTLRTRKLGVKYVRKRQIESLEQGEPITPSVIRVADKIEKASEASMLAGALSTHRLHDLASAEAMRKRLKESSGKIVQKYGEIRVYQARADIQQDEEDEKEVVNMRNKRIQKVWHKKFKEVVKELDHIHVVGIQLREVDIIKGWD
jgi:hypothetical protein